MRICVVGDGIAGTLLSWRLATRARVQLVTGGATTRRDATGASGGLVRGFETARVNAADAVRSLAELYGDAHLRAVAGFRETGSVYLTRDPLDPATLGDIEDRLPGSVSVTSPAAVTERYGLHGDPADGVAVVERRAGFLSPGRLRDAIMATLPALGVEVVRAPLARVEGDDHPRYEAGGTVATADAIVLATGAWTGPLLAASGLDAGGLRTKAVQYTIFEVVGSCPPPFVDERSGLYGRPAGPGRILLGLPSDRWDVPPPIWVAAAEVEQVRAIARTVLPGLRLLAAVCSVAAVDSYAEDGQLRLRRVAPGVFTFTGGSGGAAKTALAAAARAAAQLLPTAVPALQARKD